jgi:2,3-bisphosphoglycerate-dependent phosphoglycerate mutase|uniref:Phosphoglycerate mutase family protein n=1 Tax=viral metagenome TaxID=1070528 RepID=A0A6C0EFA6_9ZZZZ
MKIYILRHEDRTQDCSFFSPLTSLGLERSEILVENLNNCNINFIFSSPFIRTLQTIRPFSIKKNIKINLEYGLSEIHHEDIIPKKAVGNLIPEYLANDYNYNCSYKSIIKHTKIKYPEKYTDVVKRVTIILHNLIKKYFTTDYNILIVTHQSLCCAILEIINNKSKILKESSPNLLNINSRLLTDYPKGKLCLVFNDGWDFKVIN